jgi:NitT/TauT family transport system substrate-binding protein
MIARRVVLAGAVVLGLAVAGCSSSSNAASTTSSGATSATTPAQTTKLTVGTSPTISNASLYLPTEDGTFAKNNLDVTPVVIQSGAQAIPQLLNGQIQFAAADPLSSILAISKNVPLEIVVGGNVVPSDQSKDPSGLIVKSSSSIQSLADLDGKTVAVNALSSLGQVGLEAAIDAKGGNSKSVKFVEVGFSQMVAAVQSGTADAAATNEPFITAAKAAGEREVPLGGLATSMAGVPQVVYLTSKSYASSHPDVVKAFAASINAADATLGQNPGLIRTVGAKSTTINAATLAKITLPDFGPKLALDSLTKLETLMVKYGVLSAPVQNLGQSVYGGS